MGLDWTEGSMNDADGPGGKVQGGRSKDGGGTGS
jgi:hypothetical protein